MSSEQYWRNQLAQTEAEYEQIIQGLRDEVEKQRRRCTELMHDQAMQRATAAIDVRNFCVNYVAETKQQQQQQHQRTSQSSPTSASASMSASAHAAKNVESVPLPALLSFLHEYSHGLLQLPENRRKRERADVVMSPLHHRLRQRFMARQRATGREDYVLEEGEGAFGSQPPPQVDDGGSPLLGPSSGAPAAGPRYANAAITRVENFSSAMGAGVGQNSHQFSALARGGMNVNNTSNSSNPTSNGNSFVAEQGGAGGGGGPVMAASAFGLPTLPPR